MPASRAGGLRPTFTSSPSKMTPLNLLTFKMTPLNLLTSPEWPPSISSLRQNDPPSISSLRQNPPDPPEDHQNCQIWSCSGCNNLSRRGAAGQNVFLWLWIVWICVILPYKHSTIRHDVSAITSTALSEKWWTFLAKCTSFLEQKYLLLVFFKCLVSVIVLIPVHHLLYLFLIC